MRNVPEWELTFVPNVRGLWNVTQNFVGTLNSFWSAKNIQKSISYILQNKRQKFVPISRTFGVQLKISKVHWNFYDQFIFYRQKIFFC